MVKQEYHIIIKYYSFLLFVLVGAISISFVGQSPSVLMESAGSLAINFSLNATASEDITVEVNTTDSSATGIIESL